MNAQNKWFGFWLENVREKERNGIFAKLAFQRQSNYLNIVFRVNKRACTIYWINI